jgi:hypothetical protein
MTDVTELLSDSPGHGSANLMRKLSDAEVPGSIIEFDPDEADQAGAFLDDAITAEDALSSAPDLAEGAP